MATDGTLNDSPDSANHIGEAYKDVDFLVSADARVLCILAEFLEPQIRFERGGVSDTIVTFGWALTSSPEKARKALGHAEQVGVEVVLGA
jgi:hypothetical protein